MNAKCIHILAIIILSFYNVLYVYDIKMLKYYLEKLLQIYKREIYRKKLNKKYI